jgi:hypothetical protein
MIILPRKAYAMEGSNEHERDRTLNPMAYILVQLVVFSARQLKIHMIFFLILIVDSRDITIKFLRKIDFEEEFTRLSKHSLRTSYYCSCRCRHFCTCRVGAYKYEQFLNGEYLDKPHAIPLILQFQIKRIWITLPSR